MSDSQMKLNDFISSLVLERMVKINLSRVTS